MLRQESLPSPYSIPSLYTMKEPGMPYKWIVRSTAILLTFCKQLLSVNKVYYISLPFVKSNSLPFSKKNINFLKTSQKPLNWYYLYAITEPWMPTILTDISEHRAIGRHKASGILLPTSPMPLFQHERRGSPDMEPLISQQAFHKPCIQGHTQTVRPAAHTGPSGS